MRAMRSSTMPPVTCSRDQVIAAIDLYGKCWTEQNPSLLGELFTADAIYVERAYDTNATFRGLEAIQEYWKYQIVGKQSNIRFRHAVDEMVRDADKPVAVVKWLAAFTNRRENRAGATSDKTFKRVRFSQMAKLMFDQDSGKICYLEEYAQACTGPGVRWWPDFFDDHKAVSDAELWSRVRQDPIVPKAVEKNIVTCTHCGKCFPSKSQLFKHLRSLEEEKKGIKIWICLSVGYVESADITDKLGRALSSSLPEEADVETDSLTWAVPPEFSASAIVNIASVKLSKRYIDSTVTDGLLTLLNEPLRAQGVYIHTAAKVDRPCIQERREFEKYEAFIPWAVLQGQGGDKDDSAVSFLPEKCGGWSRVSGHKRRPLEETKAGDICDLQLANRLRDGARLLKDGGRSDLGHFANESEGEIKIRVRASAMNEPFHQFCRISVSIRQPKAGLVERIIALLVAYGRNLLNDDELTVSAMKLIDGENLSDRLATSIRHAKFPSLCLLEPALTKYEGKARISLCTSSVDVSDSMRKSLDTIEYEVIRKLKQDEMKQWVVDPIKNSLV